MIHTNRFSEFEEKCTGGIHLAVWKGWLDTFSDVQNQLTCFLSTIEMCKFVWAGSALVGIHVTVPFISMLLDHKVTPRQLFTVLPSLYNDICYYPQSMTNLCCFDLPSLQPYFPHPLERHTSPYGVPVCQKLKEYIKTHDQNLMDNYLMQVSQNLGAILKRQHDDKYGFGDHIDSNLQNEKNGSENVNDPDATNTESVENYFGNLDQEIRKTVALGFGKCNDDLVVKYS